MFYYFYGIMNSLNTQIMEMYLLQEGPCIHAYLTASPHP